MAQPHAPIRCVRPGLVLLSRALVACLLWLTTSGCVIVYVNPFLRGKAVYEEVVVQEADGWLTARKILLMDIDGVIVDMELSSILGSTESTVAAVKEQLRRAERDPLVRAVVLRLNTPGGGVTASDIVYREIVEFKKRTKIPVVACIMDVGASGGYYVAMAADEVVIHPTGVTGSIGVIGSYITLNELMKKIGIGSVTVKSGEHKDMGSPFRPITDQERKIFQGIIDDMHKRFVAVVAEGRPELEEEGVRALADGRIYTADQAMDAHLVDHVGYLDDAIKVAKHRAKLRDARVVAYKRPGKYKENIYSAIGSAAPAGGNVNFVNVNMPRLLEPNRPVFMYLWAPEL